MYRVPGEVKRDPARRWALPDRVFFACGACHVLTHAFLERVGTGTWQALWLKPAAGYTGNHIVAAGPGLIFDYHGLAEREAFLRHTWAKARRWWPGWDATLVPLPPAILVSEALSRTYGGLWLREPRQFRHDALPRAHAFLNRSPAVASLSASRGSS
ncbi:hypothetical protein ACE7GA_08585 [Roseomonas sp. CCTCC AB2023176]|uniref:hypothetical protein n=1 Tax=Roseomonas sp. CCTCC AB2023176 TaxID=3342640 RepID=UPI0035DD7FA9